MKKVAISLCLLVLSAAVSLGQQPQKKPLIIDYLNALNYFQECSPKTDDPENYKGVTFENDEKKTLKFEDLPDIQKDVFYLMRAESCSNQLLQLHTAWSNELKQHKGMTKDRRKRLEEEFKDAPLLKRPPSESDFERFVNEILELRKSHAVKYEQIIKSVFEKQKDIIPKKDRNHYLRRVQTWHDQHQLIERKKK